MSVLLADIGGTHTRCGLAGPGGDLAPAAVFRNAESDGAISLLARYLAGLPADLRPGRAALAVAAPVRDGEAALTNCGWRLSRRELEAALGLGDVQLLNDFEALALALPEIPADGLLAVGAAADADPRAPRVVLGPGTGLGMAALVPVAGGWQAVPGEGGHATLAAADEEEAQLIAEARARFGHCSAERLLSGPGLSLIHAALHGGTPRAPESIGAGLAAGDADCHATFAAFFRLLGGVAGNLALTLGATGGVYLGGGILPRHAAALAASGFRERFEAKGRYRDYLRAIPTWLITAPNPALPGLVAFARRAGWLAH